ncbi:MAG: hypothetical protein AAFR35_09240 [Pseudomonadota bacterium]
MPSVPALISLTAEILSISETTLGFVTHLRDGSDYLERNHPDAKRNFADLIEEMEVAIRGLAEVTLVIASFRFTMQGSRGSMTVSEAELRAFNDHVTKQSTAVAAQTSRLRQLKASCSRIIDLRDALDQRAPGPFRMFSLLGTGRKKEIEELSRKLDQFYSADQNMIDLLQRTAKLARAAVRDVQNQLGTDGLAYAENAVRAAMVFKVYADAFEAPEARLSALADQMHALHMDLRA